MNTVRCTNCMWEGKEEDLKIWTDLGGETTEVEYFKGCPNCKTDEYLMDIMEKEPKYLAPENKTLCESSSNGMHDWEWDEDRGDWYCVLCGVYHEQQEN